MPISTTTASAAGSPASSDAKSLNFVGSTAFSYAFMPVAMPLAKP